MERGIIGLLKIAAAAVRPSDRDELRRLIEAAKMEDQPPEFREAIYELALQLHLFAGFPAALEALRVLQQVWPMEYARPSIDDIGSRYNAYAARGQVLYQEVYARNAETVEREMLRLSPDLAEWALIDGYGKTLSRSGLAIRERELCTVAMLTRLGWDRQLYSHILGAKHVHASDEDIALAIEIGAGEDTQSHERALALLRRA